MRPIGYLSRILTIFWCGLLLGLLAVRSAGAQAPLFTQGSSWGWELTSGFDSFLHSYALATDDTTEVLSEFLVQAGLTGRSDRRARQRWRFRVEGSFGSELIRERAEGEFRLVEPGGADRLRLLGRLWGRQYRSGTEYSQSSDNWEGRGEVRVAPLIGRTARLELRGWVGGVDFRSPSTLEVDHRDRGIGAFVRSAGGRETAWGAGARLGRRTYPDSTVIDRDTWSVETDLDHQRPDGGGVRFFQRSERRLVQDETVRPSAWLHWMDANGAVPAGSGKVFLDLQAEAWRYAWQSDAYFNSTRVSGAAGYRWGDILAATWQVALAGERLAAGDSPEAYTQIGLRSGVESYGGQVGGSLTLEYGRRVYAQDETSLTPDAVDLSLLETSALYTNFNYWKIWLLGSWRISPHVDLELMANYEPESHTEKSDDAAVGFASLRLRWRP